MNVSSFETAVSAADVQPNQMTVVEINGRKIILTRWQGKVVAFSNRCPHAAADLCQGELYRGKIECPDHQYVFNVGNGRILWPPDEPLRLKRYETREENGRVYLESDQVFK